MLKKILALLLALTMMFSVVTLLAACEEDSGKKKSSSSKKDDDEDEDEDEDDEDNEDEDGEDEDKDGDEEDEDKDDEDEETEPDEDEETEPTEAPTEPVADCYDGSKVTITFAHTMGYSLQSVLDAYIEKFNEQYPNITVQQESYGSWYDIENRISTEILTGEQPNIAYCYPDHLAAYNNAGALVALNKFIADNAKIIRADGKTETFGLTRQQINNFIPAFYNEGLALGDGNMYSLPLNKSTEVMYYNKTFFEANGLDVPTTWEEMEAVCRAIKEIDPTCIPLGYDSEENLFITLCEQFGYDYTSATGDHVLFNNDDCKKMVEVLHGWYNDGLLTTQNLYGAYTSGLFSGNDGICCYMSIGSSGGATYNLPDDGAFEVGVAAIPQADPRNPKTICQGPSLCMLKDSDTSDQELYASWLFMKFLTTDVDFQVDFSMTTGYMPVIQSAVDHTAYQIWLGAANGYEQITARVAGCALENADSYFTSPVFVGSSTVRWQVGILFLNCMGVIIEPGKILIDEIDYLFDEAYQVCLDTIG